MGRKHLLYGCAGVCGALALASAWMGAFGAPGAAGAASAAPAATASPATPATTSAASVPTPTTSATFPHDSTPAYRVVKVVDGDTLDIDKDGETVRLRLVGMDTPEVVDPRKPVQCFGKEASAEGHTLLDGQYVRLEYDKVAGTYDRYGRTLAYVYRASDGLFYNLFMIQNGYAHEYDYQNQAYTYRDAFKAAQAAAESADLGFWSPATCGGDTTKPASTESR